MSKLPKENEAKKLLNQLLKTKTKQDAIETVRMALCAIFWQGYDLGKAQNAGRNETED